MIVFVCAHVQAFFHSFYTYMPEKGANVIRQMDAF